MLLNITEDHLDRYEYKFENYIRSKFNVIKNQTQADTFIYCADDPVITAYIETNPLHSNLLPFTMQYELPKGAYISGSNMVIAVDGEKLVTSVFDFMKEKAQSSLHMAAGLAEQPVELLPKKIRYAKLLKILKAWNIAWSMCLRCAALIL